jgi:hypothetical protein
MTEKKELNIYQKLVEVRKSIDGFKKDATGYGYRYVSGTQVLSSIKAKMDELGIILEPHLISPITKKLEPHPINSTTEKSAKGYVVDAEMKMIWVNADNPADRIEVSWYMTGEQKDPSQAFGSGLTYSERYFLLKFFNVPTDEDDPDKTPSGKIKSAPTKEQDRKMTDTQIKNLFVEYHKGSKEEAKEDYEMYVDMPKDQQKDIIAKILSEVKK